MDRELLLEVGCEELPAAWLPPITRELADRLAARLKAFRLHTDGPVETYSTPRRLTARAAKVAERQTDFEETLTGPPLTAAFAADGQPTPAAIGFARKHGVTVPELAKVETPKGVYLAYHRHQRGKAAVDVLSDVLAATLRDLTFPKPMHWDAVLDDGRGELLFGRPIRWMLFLYGGRVVPFTIRRAAVAQGPLVQEVRSGAVTYGHRFLATSGRAGRAVKVRSFQDYRARLAEHFVILDRRERHDRIARGLDTTARRLQGRVLGGVSQSALLDEVPDLVEYPHVVYGTFAPEFLALPHEVLATTLIHHQHFFPIVDESGKLKAAFLAVINIEPEDPAAIQRNAERVVAARLRDAAFFWDADRKVGLDARLPRLDTIVFHKALGSYRQKADRLERLAGRLAADVLGRPDLADHARRAGRLAKADLATDMVGEFPELQGIVGGIYAREAGAAEEVWRAMYHHYLPIAVEPDAPPRREDLGAAAVTWAAVSLADKLDTLVGMFSAGERPSGSRDPFALRRQAHGALRILIDLPELTGSRARPSLQHVLELASEPFGALPRSPDVSGALSSFILERLEYSLEQRGSDVRNVRAVVRGRPLGDLRPLELKQALDVLPEFTASEEFRTLATTFKRVKNIARELPLEEFQRDERLRPDLAGLLREPSEATLLTEVERRQPVIAQALERGDFRAAFSEASRFAQPVSRFFDDIFVMVDDAALRRARLRLMRRLQSLILRLGDISEIVAESET